MHVKSLQLYQFRNLASSEIDLNAQHVTLIGDNGEGKSNFLEALYMICYGSSFRTRKTRELIRHGKDDAFLKAVIGDGNISKTSRHPAEKRETEEKKKTEERQEAAENRENENGNTAPAEHIVHIKLRKGSVQIFVDKKEIKDRKELIYLVPCILFSHDDMSIVSGPPEARRTFFNQTMCLYDPLFLDDIRSYNRILRQRNAALKEGRTELLPVYDRQLADAGMIIQKQRERTAEEFNTMFPDVFADISGIDRRVEIRYRASWKECNAAHEAAEQLRMKQEQDLRFLTTTSGPHRDRFSIVSQGRDFTSTASTGQLRLVSLVFRTAQAAFYRKKTGKLPVLLLDDVLLELDPGRRERFLDRLEGYEQAVFTFLPDESYFRDGFSSGIDYSVQNGVIET